MKQKLGQIRSEDVASPDQDRHLPAMAKRSPLDDPGTTELVDGLRTRLGERWLEGDWELGELRSRLGLRLGLRGGALGIAFVLIVAVGGSVAILGWAGVVSAARDGDASLLRPYTIIPLVLWLVAVWYVLRRFRRS